VIVDVGLPQAVARPGRAVMTALELVVDGGVPGVWDQMTGGPAVPVSRRWIEVVDRFGPGYRTFTLYAGNTPVLAMGGAVVGDPLPQPRVDPYHILSGRSAHLGLIPDGPHPWQGISADDVMPCLLLMYPNYVLYPVGPAALDRAVTGVLVEEIRRWAAARGISSLALLYISDEGNMLSEALAVAGAPVIPLTSSCHMTVNWHDFRGYLAVLPRGRRSAVRYELRTLAERGIDLAEEKDPDLSDPELLRLRCQLVSKYSGHCDTERERRVFEKVTAGFTSSEICLTTARRAGKLLGFSLFLQESDHLVVFFTGTDYEDPDSRFTYFATMFYLPATLAVYRGVRQIDYGLGSWEAKRLRGCGLTPLYASVLSTDPDQGHDAARSGRGAEAVT
jgi:uncharacterized protein